MDFFRICVRETKKGAPEIYPDFIVGRSQDLMVRGRSFYAVWDEEAGLWSTDEYDVQRIVDRELAEAAKELEARNQIPYDVKYLRSFGSMGWSQFRKFLMNISDNSHQLDQNLTFANSEVKKSDYASRRLPYSLAPGDHSAWDELVGTLYSVEERAKIEWAIGAVVSGDAKRIQKFLVFYGPPGSGKSTILNVVQRLFEGYTTTFDAKALGSANGTFATEVFKNNPLVAIQHDGDLSKIEDNTRLNSIIAHEEMPMNEKFKPSYTARVNAFLFMGTNQPVKISDAKSGIIRRLIDVHPTGVKIPINHYLSLMSRVEFELGAIAHHCLEVYQKMGKNYYNNYRPLEMMFQTDIFFNFIEANYDVFKSQDYTTLKQAYKLYKEFCDETGIDKKLPQYKVREELRNYFDHFYDRTYIDGAEMRSVYKGFNANKFKAPKETNGHAFSLVIDESESILDELLADQPAQYAKEDGTPEQPWAKVTTTLKDLDTTKLHYVKVPENHIVIDFDLEETDARTGETRKSLERNLEAASVWPPTYAELSKSGRGVHLHYTYTGGNVGDLASQYSDGIEVKVYRGNASLRRQLSKCNRVDVGSIASGLPVKEKKMLPASTIQSEKGLRELIARNLRKEIHPGTKPSIDFIHHILEEAYENGMVYDVTDLRPKIMAFAANSTNQNLQCLKLVQTMKWKSENEAPKVTPPSDDRIAIFDCEVYPNLFVICWKYEDSDTVVKMVNPSAAEVESLFALKLVGFYNRRFDNHILYAASMGYDNKQLFELSQKLINNNRQALFGAAYDLSYADVWDYSSKKQSLKKFQLELGVPHVELDIPWDQPVPEELWDKVVKYCENDVRTTEAVHKARKQDFVARQILADLSGLTVNDTTQKHTAKIIFGDDKRAHEQFVYTDLSEQFPGYRFDAGKSTYKGEEPGEGGYVYAEPGMYDEVAVLDVASMHPTSIIELNLFGDKYTPRFAALVHARVAIKNGKYDHARKMLGGVLAPYLQDEKDAKELAYALKIVINIVYGLTSAKFDNPFRDVRNKDNIVAKRGALFMIDLKQALQAQGYQVVHIKTDSVKIPHADRDAIAFVMEFGMQYGYTFEHETTYEKMCLVNDAVYIAKNGSKWEAVGAQFQHPYVFKTLFSGEEPDWSDLREMKQVQKGAMYLDFDAVNKPMHSAEAMRFVGRSGVFVPVLEEFGGILYRSYEDKLHAVQGTKGRFWMEAEEFMFHDEEEREKMIDMDYFEKLAEEAVLTINKFGDFESFVS